MNSVIVAVTVTLGRVLFDSMDGYALARNDFRGRAIVFNAVSAVMAVPAIVLLIPKFLVLNYLGIYNTYPALFVPLMIDAAGVFIMRQFFVSIPVSIEEAARIDGAGRFRTFWSIAPKFFTLTRGIAQLTSGGLGSGQQFPISMAAALLMTIPTALVFIVFQRFFTQGANAGAEKG